MLGFDDLSDETSLSPRLAAVCRQYAELAVLGCDDEQWSYERLAGRAAHIAQQLAGCGMRAGDRVGLYLDRSPELLAAVLACIRAGLCFVPLEPELPLSRLNRAARQARVRLVLATTPLHRVFAMPVHVLRPGWCAPQGWPEQDDDLPACLLLRHEGDEQRQGRVIARGALALFLQETCERIEACTGSRWLFTTVLDDTAALLEMLGPLWVGGYLEIAPARLHREPQALAALLRRRPDINTLQGDGPFWRRLLGAGWCGHRGMLALCSDAQLDGALDEQRRRCGFRIELMDLPTDLSYPAAWLPSYGTPAGASRVGYVDMVAAGHPRVLLRRPLSPAVAPG
ncbi:AMP-binding protein [Pseudomonas sp. MYb185]|uniref:AMP-binding protein n=1 Tax=Pseudomonas sp. MYb185 TaxID=1848729 RepID=UPI000CFA8853|nr:AMP-binding protein [Pseudomonas sp. MYb185]PRB82689.1 hypothetical protein CQ007_05140 [Pseudomonas sp. MYb185]